MSRVADCSSQVHADIDFIVVLRHFPVRTRFSYLLQLFNVSFDRPPFQLRDHVLVADHLTRNFAIDQHHGRAAAGAYAAGGHQADLAVLRCLSLLDAQVLFGCGYQLVGALDVAGRAGADASWCACRAA